MQFSCPRLQVLVTDFPSPKSHFSGWRTQQLLTPTIDQFHSGVHTALQWYATVCCTELKWKYGRSFKIWSNQLKCFCVTKALSTSSFQGLCPRIQRICSLLPPQLKIKHLLKKLFRSCFFSGTIHEVFILTKCFKLQSLKVVSNSDMFAATSTYFHIWKSIHNHKMMPIIPIHGHQYT